jgi:hypothetical protein
MFISFYISYSLSFERNDQDLIVIRGQNNRRPRCINLSSSIVFPNKLVFFPTGIKGVDKYRDKASSPRNRYKGQYL